MKNKDFLEIFDGIDEKFIDEAKNSPEQPVYAVETQSLKQSSKRYILINVLKTAACAAVICAVAVPVLILSGRGSDSVTPNGGLPENPIYEGANETTDKNTYTDSTVTDKPVVTTNEPSATTEPSYDPRNEIAPGIHTNGTIVCEQNGHHRGIVLYDNSSKRDDFVQYINAFAEDLGNGIETYVMITPTSGEYYTPRNFAEYNASQSYDISYIAGGLSDKVTNVDCVGTLKEHIDEEIYLRTDHHWQPLGAYYAAGEFAKAANVPFPELNTYEKRDIEEYVGTLYSVVTQDANMLNDPETFTYYIPANNFECYYYDTKYNFESKDSYFLEMPVAYSYGMFMGGDNKIVRIETDVNNGRKLAVFKDCYGNAEIPFLTSGFEEIYVCDIRYFDLNAVEFIKEHGITDVLFTMCTFSATGANCEYIETIRTNPTSAKTIETTAATGEIITDEVGNAVGNAPDPIVLTPGDTDLIAECVINSEFLNNAHAQGHSSCTHHGLTIEIDNNNTQTILPAKYGENVYALCSGTVVCAEAEDEGDCGRHVSVMLDDGTYITYGHLSEMHVHMGDTVTKNQLLGCAGSTGTITDCGVGYYHHTEAHHHNNETEHHETVTTSTSHHGSSHHSDNHH